MRMDFKGGHKKSKTILFSKKEIRGMYYDRKYNVYSIYPDTPKLPKSKVPYAAFMTFTAGKHHGKQALGDHGFSNDHLLYFYRK